MKIAFDPHLHLQPQLQIRSQQIPSQRRVVIICDVSLTSVARKPLDGAGAGRRAKGEVLISTSECATQSTDFRLTKPNIAFLIRANGALKP
ncbi:hypothetical protein ACLKA7_005446 [Drosophila subpalustris]